MRQPNPRHFTTCDAFEAAYVAWATQSAPRHSPYDSHEEGQRKARSTTAMVADAQERAVSIYMAMLEDAEEQHERGVGPGWD